MMQAGYAALTGAIESLITPEKAIGLARSLFSNSEFAALLAGTPDRKSKAYKAALRNVERWHTSGAEKRKPSEQAKQQVASLLKKDRGAVEKSAPAGGVTLNAEGTFVTSSDRRFRKIKIHLEREVLADLAYQYNNDAPAEDLEEEFWGERGYGHIFDYIEGLRMEVS